MNEFIKHAVDELQSYPNSAAVIDNFNNYLNGWLRSIPKHKHLECLGMLKEEVNNDTTNYFDDEKTVIKMIIDANAERI